MGEPIAACIGETRAEAEDLAQAVMADIEPLEPVIDMLAARRPGAPLVHDDWSDNVVLETAFDGDMETAAANAAVSVTKEYRMNRQAMVPMEARAVLAEWDTLQDQLIVYA